MKIYFKWLVILIVSMFSQTAFAQITNSPSNDALNGYQFANVYNTGNTYLNTVIKDTINNELYIWGSTTIGNYAKRTLLKADLAGNIISSQSYDIGNAQFYASKFIEMSNGDFMVYGGIDASSDYLVLMRLTPSGSIVWSKKLTFSNLRRIATEMTKLHNVDEFILTCWYDQDDFVVIKVNEHGNVIQSRKIGNSNDDQLFKVIPYGSGCVVVGETDNGGLGHWDGVIVHLDNNLNTVWKYALGTSQYDVIYDVYAKPNGNLILSGTTKGAGGTNYDCYIGEFNPNILSFTVQVFNGVNNWERATDVYKVKDGFITKVYEPNNSSNGHFLVKYDKNLNFKWSKKLVFSTPRIHDIKHLSSTSDKMTITGYINDGSQTKSILLNTSTDLNDCIATDFSLISTYTKTFNAVTWNTNIQNIPITVSNITVTPISTPLISHTQEMVSLGDNATICQGDSQSFDIGTNFTNTLWHNGTTGQTYTSQQDEIVTVQAMNNYGKTCYDTAIVAVNDFGILNQDTSIQIGNSVTLTAQLDTLLVGQFKMDFNDEFDYLFPTDNQQEYLIRVEGTYSYVASLSKIYDAAYYNNNGSISPLALPILAPYDTIRPIPDVYSVNHQYSYKITGDGQPIHFKFWDSFYSDNWGDLTFTIYKLPKPLWSTGQQAHSITVSPTETTTYYVSDGIIDCMDSVTVTMTFPCNYTDSLSLVNLYNNLSGLPWNLSQPIHTWQGVVLSSDSCYVQELHLSGMGLQGTFPAIDFSYLTVLRIDNNQFTSLDCGYSLPYLFEVHLENNHLNFGSNINCYINNIPILSYAPQNNIPIFNNGGTLSVNAGGNMNNNTYQWYRDGVLVAMNTGNNQFSPTMGGVYYCKVSNSILTLSGSVNTNLILTSNSLAYNTTNCNSSSLDLGQDKVVCTSSQYVIAALPNMMTYQWNTGDTTNSITVSTAGTYSVMVTDSCGQTASDTISIEFRCNYEIADTVDCKDLTFDNTNNYYTTCIPFETTQAFANNMVGIDVSIKYDTALLEAVVGNNGSNALTIGNVISNNGLYQQSQVEYFINQEAPDQIRVVVFYKNSAPSGAMLSGIGELFCLKFVVKPTFPLNSTTNLEYFDIVENYSVSNHSIFSTDTLTGNFTLTGDTLISGKIVYHDYHYKPMVYNPNSPIQIWNTDASCSPVSGAVSTDSLGYFNKGHHSNYLKIEKNVPTMSFADVFPIINSQDRYLAHQVAAGVNIPLSGFQLLAIDTNADGMVTGLDAYNISQRAFHNDKSVFLNQDFRFIDSVTVNNNPAYANITPNSIPIIPDCIQIMPSATGFCNSYDSVYLHAIIPGDVDNSWLTNANSFWKSGGSDYMRLKIADSQVDSCIFKIPVTYQSLNHLTALDGYFDIDTNRLKVLDVVPNAAYANILDIDYRMEGNTLIIMSFSTQYGGFQTNNPLFYIKVESIDGTVDTNDFIEGNAYLNGRLASQTISGSKICSPTTSNFDIRKEENQFFIFPNPSSDIMNIRSSNDELNVNTIEIYSITGQFIRTYTFENTNQATINVQDLSKGTYIIRLNNEVVKRWVKM